jgi:hypothetical protein
MHGFWFFESTNQRITMISKTITYTDFAGKERTETLYFHLTQEELVLLEFEHEKGFADYLEKIAATEDRKQLIGIFKEMVLMSYGERSEDGRNFRKSDAIREDFASTNGYVKIFMDLVNGTVDEMVQFIAGVFPNELTKGVDLSRVSQQAAEGKLDIKEIREKLASPEQRQAITPEIVELPQTPPTPPPPPAPPVQVPTPEEPATPPTPTTDTTPPTSGWVDPTA